MTTNRRALGTERVGIPLSDVAGAVLGCLAAHPAVDPAVLSRYVQGFLFGGLPAMLDAALPNDDDLARVDPHRVRHVALVLMRDALLRRHPPAVVDPLISEACARLGADEATVLGSDAPFDLESLEAEWAQRLAADLGLPPRGALMVVLGHSAWVEPVG